MSQQAVQPWHEVNQQVLLDVLVGVRLALHQHSARAQGEQLGGTLEHAAPSTRLEGYEHSALARLCAAFGLSPFERDVLLLCAGVELEGDFAALCAAAQGDAQRPFPTFSLALAALPEPHWSALTPAAPLRRWALVEFAPRGSLTTAPLRISERVLHYLAGVSQLDEQLEALVELAATSHELMPSHQVLAEQIVAHWGEAKGGALPIIQLVGSESESNRAIAAAVCMELSLHLHILPALNLPTGQPELRVLARLWEREAALDGVALLIDCDDLPTDDKERRGAVQSLAARLGSPLLLACRERMPIGQRASIAFDVERPSAAEQHAAWQIALGDGAAQLNGQVDRLVEQFDLGVAAIHAASAEAVGRGAQIAGGELGQRVWEACRAQARPLLDDLAQRIASGARWDDLVLPAAQRQTLGEIAAHVCQRAQVYGRWGFAERGGRGLGISALFAGPSGTGKTMAAEVLANELRLDLYRIDLSAVVSKYIGETEKNLRRIFDAAEAGGAVLLFDEADALFGKRSEVKDSHDRYANIEVSYLLQRMEAYRGLAVLTTNMKQALDTAFLRRIRFVVQFPFPDAAQRAEIWRRAFPAAAPTEGLDVAKLARLNVAGGNIRNIALGAAFLAADERAPVQMRHLLRAARVEYAKLEKPLTESEISGWISGEKEYEHA